MEYSAIQRLLDLGMYETAHNTCIMAGWYDEARDIVRMMSDKGYFIAFDIDGFLVGMQ
jgi:pentatricopeptide repeat protein